MAIRYLIENGERNDIVVKLRINDEGVELRAGQWTIFQLKTDGTGHLVGSIPENNKEGLKVDLQGRVILDNR